MDYVHTRGHKNATFFTLRTQIRRRTFYPFRTLSLFSLLLCELSVGELVNSAEERLDGDGSLEGRFVIGRVVA